MYDSLKDKLVDDTILEREQIIVELKKLVPIENDELKWKDLCFFTKFDSSVTALAYGLNWEPNINKATLGQLKMALYNMINYPNDDDESNSKKAGYGKTQERIDFLYNYRGIFNA